MPPEESSYPVDWLRIAEKDLKRLRLTFDAGDPDGAGFFLRQSLEKLFKAFLLSKGWKLKRIHDLEVLLNESLAFDASLEKFRSLCQKATAYYLLERYPFVSTSGLSEKELAESLNQAKELLTILRSKVIETKIDRIMDKHDETFRKLAE